MWTGIGLLVLRLAVGLTMAAHGSQKVLGWFGGPGLKGQTEMVRRMGMAPARFWAWVSALAELGGGLLFALGLLTPAAAAAVTSAMLMAIAKVHWRNGFWNGQRGFEFNLTLISVAVAVGLTGPGRFAVDAWLPSAWSTPQAFLVCLIIGVLGVGAGLVSSAVQAHTRHQTA
jgi:putative oxidoreductase